MVILQAVALPPGVATGITWAAGAAVLAVAALIDAAAIRKGGGIRIAAATCIYYSGWLTVFGAIGLRQWWVDSVHDPNWILIWRLAGLAVNVLIALGVVGLVLAKGAKGVAAATGPAADKIGLTGGDANKVRITSSVVWWTFAAAALATDIPAHTWAATWVTGMISRPGDALGATVVSWVIGSVGGAA